MESDTVNVIWNKIFVVYIMERMMDIHVIVLLLSGD